MEPGYSPLFLLALVAGFNFTKEWETTRYQLAREDGHKLYFRSTFWGLVVCVVTAALIVVFTYTAMGLYHQHLVHPFDTAIPLILGTLIISPFAAYLYASILNRFADALEFYYDALKENEFEYLLVTAMTSNFMIMATMEDKKVYVGWVYKVSDPAKDERKYFSIIPVMTGFRNDSLKVEFTTFYDQLYLLTVQKLSHLNTEHFALVLPASRMVSCRFFDASAYARFQEFDDDAASLSALIP